MAVDSSERRDVAFNASSKGPWLSCVGKCLVALSTSL